MVGEEILRDVGPSLRFFPVVDARLLGVASGDDFDTCRGFSENMQSFSEKDAEVLRKRCRGFLENMQCFFLLHAELF